MSQNETITQLMNSGFNLTLLNNTSLCTIDTCPISLASVRYRASLGGNAFYLALFLLLLILQLGFGFKWRTWSYAGSMFGGLALEVIGYVARVQMHHNPFNGDHFLMYLVVLTIAPCFIAAAIYLSLARIILIYGESLARFKPRTYTIIFICCDVFSLVLQAAGGGIADTAESRSLQQAGIDVMIAGLSFQVVSLTAFMVLCADFAWSVRSKGGDVSKARLQSRLSTCSVARFHMFIGAIAVATLGIYIRSAYRVAELREGFDGKLANDEVTYMILEGAMVALACIAMTALHPGFVFGRNWNQKRARAELSQDPAEKVEGEHAMGAVERK
ncbi:MAG: hypothetical protein Q9184_002855 [Pyrenodesmia sp. 2 TL-2023]